MIPVRRPAAVVALSAGVRAALAKRQQSANKLSAGDPKIPTAWGNFLSSRPKADVAAALDSCFRGKCGYCEGVAAQDIEHFYPKTQYPGRMFDWENFLRGCKNCNNFKRDQFPLTAANTPVLLDPCRDDPLDYFVWDFQSGAVGVRPEPGYEERGRTARDLLRLDMEPLREERRSRLLSVLCLLAQVCNQDPVTDETRTMLREALDHRRPYLGIVRQLLQRPGRKYGKLVRLARGKLPEIERWIAPWV
jgi:uncharacterized protein (TIGR02646 family)